MLSAQDADATRQYTSWLKARAGNSAVSIHQTDITDPWDFAGIYRESIALVEDTIRNAGNRLPLVFHLSPGTGAMSASWIILSKTRFPAELIESSRRDPTTGQYPIRMVNLPFDLSIELIDDLLKKPGEDLLRLAVALPPTTPEFSKIVYRSTAMHDVILRARRVALFRDVPVLILGESGTGKELLARAIHAASPRAGKPFKGINCGAIPQALLESELFGHVKGGFTGAFKDHKGIFEQASGGTVFLDEVGELPLHAQIALLRVLQEKMVTPVGSEREVSVNLRIIAATNRDLMTTAHGSTAFRLDLLHRLAVAIIKIPPLRERNEDIECLANYFLTAVSEDLKRCLPNVAGEFKLTPSARRRLREHDWPGNVRELQNTLVRVAVWSSSTSVSETELNGALLLPRESNNSVLDRQLGAGFDLHELLIDVRRRYLERALRAANGNQTRAAELLGITRQTFSNWASKGELTGSRNGS